jgi:CheY-like chemotaxis protein
MYMAHWKILVVDDDEEDRDMILDAMGTLGQASVLRFAPDGDQALSLLARECSEDFLPALIVLDLNMPRMNGSQVLQAIKMNPLLCSIPVIIFSTSINPFEKEKCMEYGAHSYLIKPVSFTSSVDIMKKFLAFCPPDECPA